MPRTKFSLAQLIHCFKIAVTGKEQNFTTGSIRRAVFMLAIPMILEMLMESIFAVVDIFYVSKVSVNAVATIGLTESVVTLIYAVAIGLSMAATAVVARRIGEDDVKGASQAAVQVIFLGVAVSVFISVVGILYPKEILALMGAAMWTLILSNGLNIILDPLFIFGYGPVPAYGVEGAAIATTIGRGTAVVFQLVILFFGYSKIKIALKDLVIRAGVMFNLIKVSIGGICQFLIGTSSWVFLMRIMSEFGAEVLAGYTIAIRVMMFTFMPAWGMSNAAATLVGQNLGAKKPERAEQSVWITGKYNAIFMVSVSIIYLVFAKQIIMWFNTEPEVVKYGSLCLQVIAAGYIFYGYGMVVINAFNGAGDTKTPTWINFICFWMFQLPIAYLAAITLDFGPLGVFIAITLAEALIAILGIWWFKKGTWKSTKV